MILLMSIVQGFIDDPDRDWKPEDLPVISEGFTVQQIKDCVLSLNKVGCWAVESFIMISTIIIPGRCEFEEAEV